MEILRNFILSDEIKQLKQTIDIATSPTNPCGFLPGRQETGYLKLYLREQLVPAALLVRSIQAIKVQSDYWDCFVLHYPENSFIPLHVDEDAKDGMRHVRLNAIIQLPSAGGVLTIDNQVIDLNERDAVLFFPDRQPHSVTPCSSSRLVWSVGAWIPENAVW